MNFEKQHDEYQRLIDAGPGEGYRNLHEGEVVLGGDERLSLSELRWKLTALTGHPVTGVLTKIYRRKV